ncbi:MAG: DMT family transporter [Betaproteobacteria bacterium]|jgi:drug/metabolite transporter (DMT)-like permease|nr:DMT family transporter [Rhodocyclaceae bacterium]MCA3134553.1 DMT family transporter [Rhodocyclaceae bacterium]MCA3143646.1 DMT family transporter [Rhodocyclaceae bacterium]MCA3145490.1 DMT family transporter [Rhodocyclaceae bacterium]MCE2898928.1 DMT family transporter [Betaproteobacteria bacterium]
MTRAAATAWLLLAVPFTALSAILPKLAAQPGPTTGFWRFAIACIVAVPLLGWTRRATAPAPGAPFDWRPGVAAGIAFGVDIAVWNQALLMVPAAEAMLLGHTAPLWVGLFGWMVWGRRPNAAFWIGCVLAAAGMALFVAHRLGAADASFFGLALCVLAGALYAAYILLAHRARSRMAVLPFLLVSQGTAAVVCAVCALGMGAPLWSFTPLTWLWLVASGVAGLAGGWAVVMALSRISATSVSMTMLLQVPVAALLAWWIFGEALAGAQALGALVMLAAVVLVNARPAGAAMARADSA